jgi:hypothetical protein
MYDPLTIRNPQVEPSQYTIYLVHIKRLMYGLKTEQINCKKQGRARIPLPTTRPGGRCGSLYGCLSGRLRRQLRQSSDSFQYRRVRIIQKNIKGVRGQITQIIG